VVAFEVSDLDAFVHKMKERRVVRREVFDTPTCWMAIEIGQQPHHDPQTHG
jgi:hypothetical protein